MRVLRTIINGKGGYMMPYKMDFTKRSKDVISIFLKTDESLDGLINHFKLNDNQIRCKKELFGDDKSSKV